MSVIRARASQMAYLSQGSAFSSDPPLSQLSSLPTFPHREYASPWTAEGFRSARVRDNPALNAHMAVPRPRHSPFADPLSLGEARSLVATFQRAVFARHAAQRVVAHLVLGQE